MILPTDYTKLNAKQKKLVRELYIEDAFSELPRAHDAKTIINNLF